MLELGKQESAVLETGFALYTEDLIIGVHAPDLAGCAQVLGDMSAESYLGSGLLCGGGLLQGMERGSVSQGAQVPYLSQVTSRRCMRM